MCFTLTLVSPLTLTEVRSMLPSKVTADLVPPPLRPGMLDLVEEAKTAATLAVGACACGLIDEEAGDLASEERRLREVYRKLGWSRSTVIEAVERHRVGAALRAGRGDWNAGFRRFIAEHGRNAGPTLYLVQWGAPSLPTTPTQTITLAETRDRTGSWLVPNRPVLVA